jgi:hypothetical protein
MTRSLMIVAIANNLIAINSLFGLTHYRFGKTWEITSGYLIYYIIVDLLLISLGVMSLFFVNMKEVRATVLNNNRTVISIRILSLAIISINLYYLVLVPASLGTVKTMNPGNLVLNLVFDLVAFALSVLVINKSTKFYRLQKK